MFRNQSHTLVGWLVILLSVYVIFLKFRRMKNDIQISKNFNLKEFTKTSIPIPNNPSQRAKENIFYLVEYVLQPLRDYLGVPIIVTSGYRNHAVNTLVGGAVSSQHLKGEAADIVIKGMDPLQVVKAIEDLGLPYDQVIAEYKGGKSWTHVSVKETGNRFQALKYDNGQFLGI